MSDPKNYWFSRDIAKGWPEGCVVLYRRPSLANHEFRYELSAWWRPDWVERNYYGQGDETYMIVERLKTPPPD